MPISRHDRLTRIAAALERAYGKPRFLSREEPLLDQLLYLVLQQGVPREHADRSLLNLRKEFVDWNEVRVSSISEIRSAIRTPDAATSEQKARTVRNILTRLFADRNKISLAFLKDLDEERAMKALLGLGVDPWVAATVFLLVADQPVVDHNPSVHRVLKRTVFTDRGLTPAKLVSQIEEVVPPKDLPRHYLLFARHAEAVCLAKAPNCPECVVGDLCPSNRERRRVKSAR